MPVLSVLELALRERDHSVRQALDAVLETAVAADRLGYRRFWVSEHHRIPAMSTPSPAVVAARIAGATTTIRVGAGGVMLPNHSPLATAETFASLDAMFPGRIDLGMGRGPGTYDEAVVRALRGPTPRATTHQQDVEDVLRLLDDDPDDGWTVLPDGTGTAQCWLLASSPDGARLAGELGLPLALAHFLAPEATEAASTAYRSSFRPSAHSSAPWLAVSALAICADTDAELRTRAGPAVHLVSGLQDGAPAALIPPGASDDRREDPRASLGPRGWVGTADEARSGLADLAARTTADELQLVVPVFDVGARIDVLELLAAAV